ncbi:MAG: DNRLRE domain-containing protein [Kofleriaceae bacterium]
MRRFALVVLSLVAGCKSFAYECAASSECTQGGVTGSCEPTGFCSFPDPACPSGQRYGEWSGPNSSTCVGGGGTDDAGVDAPIDAPIDMSDAVIDAPPNAIIATFGELPGSTYTNVTSDGTFSAGSMTNSGGFDHISADSGSTEEGLIRWSTIAIPPGSQVISATLSVSTIGDDNHLSAGVVRVYKLNETWDELAFTFFTRGPALWTTSGAQGTARDQTQFAEIAMTSQNRYTVPIPTAIVQGWIDDPASNAGVIFTSAGTGHLHIGAREGAAINTSQLTVTYYP